MADNRPVAEIVDEQRHQALINVLRPLESIDEQLRDGLLVATARDIEEVFNAPFEADYGHKAEVETPAHLMVDVTCLSCHQVIPDVAATLNAVTTTEKEGVGKVKLKLKHDALVHTCGQLPLPKVPADPEVEGQVGMDDIDEPGDE